MKYKLLGRSGLRVSQLGLGTMTFMEGLNWGASREESRDIYAAFVDAGGNFIDTSNSYGSSEQFIGELMGSNRDRLIVATKYSGSLPLKDANSSGNHRKSLVRSVEGSLKLLGTDYLDLLWLNSWDFMTPVEEFMRALDDLVRQGKVLYTGVSNAPAWLIARANTLAELRGWTPFVAAQVEYNLIEREVEREIVPMARALDIAVAAWAPLASGWLTGKYYKNSRSQTWRSETEVPRRLDDPMTMGFVPRTERNEAVAEEVRRIAAQTGRIASQVALNWLRQRNVIPLLGARRAEQLRENLACLEFDLSEEHILRLDDVSRIKLGYPHDFLASGMVKHHMYGGMFDRIENHHGHPEFHMDTPRPAPRKSQAEEIEYQELVN